MRIVLRALVAIGTLASPAAAADLATPDPPEVLVPAAPPEHRPFGIGLSSGTLGPGVEAEYRFNHMFGLRGSVHYFGLSLDDQVGDLDYEVEPRIFTGGLTLDYYPLRNGFRLSAGAKINGNEIDFDAFPDAEESITLGDTTYTGEQIGHANSSADFNAFSPYLGLGYERTFRNRFSFAIDIGALYQGDPDVSLTVEDPFFVVDADDLESHRQEIEDELDILRFYPIVQISTKYRF